MARWAIPGLPAGARLYLRTPCALAEVIKAVITRRGETTHLKGRNIRRAILLGRVLNCRRVRLRCYRLAALPRFCLESEGLLPSWQALPHA
jgi:hypothetical protein